MKKLPFWMFLFGAVLTIIAPVFAFAQEEELSGTDQVAEYMEQKQRDRYYPAWQQTLDEIRKQSEMQMQRNDRLKEINRSLKQEFQDLKQKYNDENNNIETLKHALLDKRMKTDAKYAVEPLQDSIRNRKIKLQQAKLKLSDLEDKLLDIEKKIALGKLRIQDAELKKNSHALADNLQEKIVAANEPGPLESRQQFEDLEAKIEEAKLQEENLERGIADEKTKSAAAAKEIEELQSEIRQLEGQKKLFLKQMTEQKKDVAIPSASSENVEQHQEARLLTVERDELQAKINVLRLQVESLEKASAVTIDPAQIQADQKLLMQDIVLMDQQNQKYREHISYLREDVKILEKLLTKMEKATQSSKPSKKGKR